LLGEEDEELPPSNSSPSDLLAVELRDERELAAEFGDDERESSGVN
jgi:hypothetical protein